MQKAFSFHSGHPTNFDTGPLQDTAPDVFLVESSTPSNDLADWSNVDTPKVDLIKINVLNSMFKRSVATVILLRISTACPIDPKTCPAHQIIIVRHDSADWNGSVDLSTNAVDRVSLFGRTSLLGGVFYFKLSTSQGVQIVC